MSSQGSVIDIKYHESTKTFHLTNGKISYIMKILDNGHVGQLYYGKAVEDSERQCKQTFLKTIHFSHSQLQSKNIHAME